MKTIKSIISILLFLIVNFSFSQTNLALGKTTEQSSLDHSGISSRAVDGNTSSEWSSGSITHTLFEANPWWKVDLGEIYNISQIDIYNRSDILGNGILASDRIIGSKIYAGNINSSNPSDYTLVATLINNDIIQQINNLNLTARYILVYLEGASKVLSLAEVEVYGLQDSQLPTTPTLSNVAQTDVTVDLNWTAATDDTAVTGYKIYKDGALKTTLGNVLTYQVTGLVAATTYNFTVTALDAAGNESALSNIVNVTTNSSSGGGGSGYWSLNNQDVYYNDGKVGIGTDSPQAKLHIKNQDNTVSSILGENSSQDKFYTRSKDSGFEIGVYNHSIDNPGNSIGEYEYAFTQRLFLNGTVDVMPNLNYSDLVVGSVFTIGSYSSVFGENAGSYNFKVKGNGHFTSYLTVGTDNPAGYLLAVGGDAIVEEIKVSLVENWPDYVFNENYHLPSLKEVENHIQINGHLQNLPTASEVVENGISLGEMNAKLLEKIEELTLYTIQQQKELENQEYKNKTLEERLAKLESLIGK
ncbi:discoidin domain-containing protein [Algibacter sp. 2305UL17-15]|uniref:galactose-binding domain-containing protein n=1 Tax=Algibacter sp. 2305UL17-15 TaxID=3231268 RepID=UPI00345B4B0C